MELSGHRSGGTEVRSGVRQGSVTIFIDDIDEELLCENSKFAEDKNS